MIIFGLPSLHKCFSSCRNLYALNYNSSYHISDKNLNLLLRICGLGRLHSDYWKQCCWGRECTNICSEAPLFGTWGYISKSVIPGSYDDSSHFLRNWHFLYLLHHFLFSQPYRLLFSAFGSSHWNK